MPKIKIEIDASSKEIVEVISGLLGVGQDIKSRKAYENYLFYNKPYGKVSMKKRTKKTVKRVKRNPDFNKSGGTHGAKRGRGWLRDELNWLKAWMQKKPVNKKTAVAFEKHFGYKRSFSSLANKAHFLRKE